MYQLRKGYKATATFKPVDADKNPTTVSGVPVWAVDSGEFTIVPVAGGLTAVLSAVGDVGEEAVLTAVADGVTASEDLMIGAGPATTATLTFGEQTPI